MTDDRLELMSRALQVVRDSQLLLQRACVIAARSEQVRGASAALLAELAAVPYADLREQVERGVRIRKRPAPRTLAIVGSCQHEETHVVDLALVWRYDRVLKISGSTLVVASSAVEQPHLAVLLDDLVDPGPLAVVVLLRALAPSTNVLVVADDHEVRVSARSLGVAACPSAVDSHRLNALLDDLVA